MSCHEVPQTTLYRPAGLDELRLVYEADMRAFATVESEERGAAR